jgi:hypothetical protein
MNLTGIFRFIIIFLVNFLPVICGTGARHGAHCTAQRMTISARQRATYMGFGGGRNINK